MVGSLAELMVMITGNSSGLKAALGESEAATTGFASKLGGIGGIAALGLGAAGVAIAAFSLKAISDVGGAYKDIEKQTGATGAALEGLKGSFRDVFSGVPESATEVATALSSVYDKSEKLNGGVKLTGDGLNALTTKFLEWSRISGASVESLVDTTTSWAQTWKMSSSEVATSMDEVEAASQSTHESVGTLTADLQKVGPAAHLLGLSFKETTVDVAGFEQAGLKVGVIQSAMQKTLADATKAGEDAHGRWTENISTLQRYTDAIGSGNKAQAEAITKTDDWKQVTEDFSARTLTQLITAVGDGTFKIGDLSKAVDASSGSIKRTADDTMSFGQKLDVFKNKLEVAFAPLGKILINILTDLLTAMQPLITVFTVLVGAFTALPGPIQVVAVGFVALLGGAQALNIVLSKFGLNMTQLPGNISGVINKVKELAMSMLSVPAKMLGIGGGGAAVAETEAEMVAWQGVVASEAEATMGAAEYAAAQAGINVETEAEMVAWQGVTASEIEAAGGAEAYAAAQATSAAATGAIAGEVGAVAIEEDAAVIGAEGFSLATIQGGIGQAWLAVQTGIVTVGEYALAAAAWLAAAPMMIMASPILMAAAAVALVVAGFVLLYETSSTFRSMIGGIIEGIKQILGWIQAIAGALMGGDFGKAGDLIKTGFIGAFDVIKNFDWAAWAGNMVKSVGESINTIKNFFGGMLDSVKNIDWGGIGSKIQGSLTGAFNTAKGAVDSVGGAIHTVAATDYAAMANNVKNQIGGAFDGVKTSVVGFAKQAETAGQNVVNALGPPVQQAINATGNVSKTLHDTLQGLEPVARYAGNGMKMAFDQILHGDFSGALNTLQTTFTNVFNVLQKMDWGTIGRKIIDEIITSVRAKAGEIMSTLGSALSGAGSAMSGFGNSIVTAFTGAFSQVSKFIGPIFDTLKNVNWGAIASQIVSTLGAAFTQIGNLLRQAFDAIKTVDWGGIAGQIISSIGGAFSNLANSWTSLLGGLKNSIMSIDWGGMLAGLLDAISGALDTLMNFDPGPLMTTIVNAIGSAFDSLMSIDWGNMIGGLVTAIGAVAEKIPDMLGGAFDSLFGGGGGGAAKTTTDPKTGKKTTTQDAGAAVGPDLTGKLVGVFEKAVALLPTVFAKAAAALLAALQKVDWGSVATKIFTSITTTFITITTWLKTLPWLTWAVWLLTTIQSVFVKIVTWFISLPWLSWVQALWDVLIGRLIEIIPWIISLDWGGFAKWVWDALVGAIGGIITWLITLDWGGFAKWVWDALVGAIGGIIIWIKSLDWGAYASWVWEALKTEIGKIIEWLKSLPWADYANTVWLAMQTALANFGSWLINQVINIGTQIWGWIIGGGAAQFGSWLINQAMDIGKQLWTWITLALGNFGEFLTNSASSFYTWLGGIPDTLKDRFSGLGEAIVTGFKNLWNAMPSVKLPVIGDFPPRLASGGYIVGEAGNEAVIPLTGSLGKNLFSELFTSIGFSPVAPSEKSSQKESNVTYNVNVTVDSEDVTRKVFDAIREVENYHHM